jgi:hypothetical protein
MDGYLVDGLSAAWMPSGHAGESGGVRASRGGVRASRGGSQVSQGGGQASRGGDRDGGVRSSNSGWGQAELSQNAACQSWRRWALEQRRHRCVSN